VDAARQDRKQFSIAPFMAIAPSGALWYLGREKIMCISEHKSDSPNTLRKGYEQPAATSVHGWRYHHIGIPTDVPRPGEYYLEQFKMYVSAFETSPCGIQWMRFEPDSPVHALIKSVPHIAFEVDNLQAAIEGKEILTAPNSPSEGVTVAMILDSGAPVELLEFRRDCRRNAGRHAIPKVEIQQVDLIYPLKMRCCLAVDFHLPD
jgi:hypothetical protein